MSVVLEADPVEIGGALPDAVDPLALSLNENPFPPLPAVRSALIRSIDAANRYPEFRPERMRTLVAGRGNLFGAGIPINLDRAISDGQLKAGDVVMMAAFAHAGDFAGAAAVRWAGRD